MNRQQLINEIFQKQSFLCVGLDTDINLIPDFLKSDEQPVFMFNKVIIDATAPYCVAYKPNMAFYESLGTEGIKAFELTVEYLHKFYPSHFILADAKRGDIGNTSAMYARTFFDLYDVDCLTLSPYMGEDSITPFLDYEGKWVAILALTSNRGSHDFQLTEDASGTPLYQRVITKSSRWPSKAEVMYVVGATQGSMFRQVRTVAPDNFLLVPGVGAQGGSLQEVCQWGMNADCGLLVNSSRGIIYASRDHDFADVAAHKARALQQQMAVELSKIKA